MTADEWFDQQLARFVARKLRANAILDAGEVPYHFLSILPAGRVMVPQSVLTKAVNKHQINLDCLRGLPSMIGSPSAIYASKTSKTSAIFQLKAGQSGETVALVIDNLNHPQLGWVHLVKSIHLRPLQQFANWESLGLTLYKE